MADNVDITPGTGATVAADLVAGALHQRVKLSLGADGTAADAPVGGGVEAGALRVTLANDSTGVLTVDGTVTAELSATDNAVLDTIHDHVETVAGAVADAHVQVDVLTAPAVRALTNADVVTAELSATDNAVLDALATSLAVIDDWDSSDHCNVRHLNATDDTLVIAAGTAVIGSAKTAESGRTMKHIKVALSASQTGATVLDPTNGTKFVLKKLIVHCTTGGNCYFYDADDDSTHAIGPALAMAGGTGWSETWDADDLYRSETADHVLKYTSGAGFTGSVYLDYFEE